MKKIVSIPPNYFYACLILCVVLRIIFPEYKIMTFPYNMSGIIVIIAGIYLVIHPWYLFKNHNTPESFEPSTYLVQGSIYKYSRNPMYVGGILILAGMALTLNNLTAFVTPVIFYLSMHFMFIPYEEKELENIFGSKYLEYKKKVRRWI